MEKELKKYLLQLARATIAEELDVQVETPPPPDAQILKEKRGVFVTLEINHRLRGCIGNIEAVYPLEEGVRRNAINAAFRDPRFPSLTKEEFSHVEIEISVLSVPRQLDYANTEELLEKLTPLKDGVIIKQGYFEATYLPQVW
ncbi:AmmeMemoRadiSam system protein A, partial [Patescibacteria group bacterium]|nr:AmmeMemoRadiSam system protein A [Patescibacteria group bacterium]